MEITGVGIPVMEGDGTLVLAGIIGTETTGTEIIGVGIVGMEITGAGITGMAIMGDTQITTTIEPIPITQAEGALPIPPIQVVTEITIPEVQQITLETKAIPLIVELIQITEETLILISEEAQQTDSTEQVQHFQEIKDNIKTIRIVHLAEDQIRIVPAARTTDRKDHILQVQEMTTIPDHTVLAQIVPEILAVAVDHLAVAEEAEEDNTSF
jgi:hypothetical protein